MITEASIRQADALGRRLAAVEMEKSASLADAILGAPVSAIAARIAAPEDSKQRATAYGLILGALMGWSAGQRSLARMNAPKDDRRGPIDLVSEHPLLSAAAAGALLGGSMRAGKAVKDIGKVLSAAEKASKGPGVLLPAQG